MTAWIGKKSAQFRLKTAKRTDTRVRFMNEIIQGIQVIKMYTWEKSFAEMVDKVRRKEVNIIRWTNLIRAALFSFLAISRISIFISLASYAYFGNQITARKVFIVSGFFNILNLYMVHFWPMAVTVVAEGFVSVKRIHNFLLSSEIKEQAEQNNLNDNRTNDNKKLRNEILIEVGESNGSIMKQNSSKIDREEKTKVLKKQKDVSEEVTQLLPSRRIENVDSCKPGVTFSDATAVWSLKEKNLGILGINLEVVPGTLCAVIGQVGSGKSTILSAIVNDLELDDGSLTINGSLSYAPQQPWLFEGSIRRNIVFIEQWDEQRYRDVCRVCALERDFELLAHGDATIVGERGMVLSGGQRARVSLARAVYRRADIYLFDDPLSAVDTHVGKHIFNECISTYLKEKCVILVTHQLQHLKDVQHIVLMDNGRIAVQGSFDQIKNSKVDSILSLTVHEEAEQKDVETILIGERKVRDLFLKFQAKSLVYNSSSCSSYVNLYQWILKWILKRRKKRCL